VLATTTLVVADCSGAGMDYPPMSSLLDDFGWLQLR
jgi:hypothetical protein